MTVETKPATPAQGGRDLFENPLGTSFSGAAWGTGTLNLYYWDSNFGDNTGSITANVVKGGVKGGAVPEPATWALMIGGFGLAGAALRRRRATATA